MPNGDKITRKQHYIPQVYLRGFSKDYLRENVKNDKYQIYCYELDDKMLPGRLVPIKSICYKIDLYEVTGKNGDIVMPNHLEQVFSYFEKSFSEYRRKLENKAFISSNYKTNCFLTGEEKVFWATYIIVQILRIPQIIDLAERIGEEFWKDYLNDKQIKNVARMFCLPFFKEMNEVDKEMQVFASLFEPMKNMTFGIGADTKSRIITSDKPVFINAKEFPCEEYEKIIFPISSRLCLYMFGGEYKKKDRKNFLFPIEESDLEEITKSLSVSAFNKIYSNHVLSKMERRYIKEIINERKSN